jgi:hypothetical protein
LPIPYLLSDEKIESMKCYCGTTGQGQNQGQTQGQAAIRNVNTPANCPAIPAGYVAMAWDDSDCTLDDWSEPLLLRNNERMQWRKRDGLPNYFKFNDVIESIAVRAGCTLTAYDVDDLDDDDDDKFSFKAIGSDLYVTLDKPSHDKFNSDERDLIEDLDDDIGSLKVSCSF